VKIFVQIASYRDPELIPTIKSLINNAKNKDNLVIAIARQFSEEDGFDDLSIYKKDKRFKIIDIPYTESKGVCWARNKVQQLYNNEEFTLQIDSHMRFEKNWDETLISMITDLQKKGYDKPLLTAYVPSYNPNNDPEGRINIAWRMVFDKFIPEGAIFFLPESIPNHSELTEPVRSRFYSAHFTFTLGCFAKEVQHNPNFYFHGEEISIAVRAFTHGYDLFHPHKVVAWHEYTRNGRTKQWDDDKEWYKKNEKSHLLNRKLFGMDGLEQTTEESYGFGKVRTLRDYEKYAGVLFHKRAVQQETVDKKYPPNTYNFNSEEEWINSFTKTFKHCINLKKEQFEKKEYDFWAVIFQDESGKEIFRKDANKEEIENLLETNEHEIKICRDFKTTLTPKKWIVWPHSEQNGWLNSIEGSL